MLPTYRRPSWNEVQHSRSAFHAVKLFFSKPSSRWLLFCFTFATSLWFIGPFLLHFGGYHPPPYHGPLHHGPISQQHPPPNVAPTIWSVRADQVKGAFLHAWDGYQRLAMPADELLPVSGGKVNNFNGWGVSLIDGLDTLWIMGLYAEFLDSIPIVANMTFAMENHHHAPFFETVIRYLGGLLSAYALSADPILLIRADDLGQKLLPAFKTVSGLPAYAVNTVTGKSRQGWNGGNVLWAEALSCQMEYKYLAHLTGRTQYYDKVEHVMEIMYNITLPNGLFPTRWDILTGTPHNNDHSVGAFADSGYEYLLKQWLMSGQSEPKARDLYLRSASAIIQNLLFLSPKRRLLYVTDLQSGTPSHIFEHLSCFLPGLFALGAQTLDLPQHDKELHQWAASGLAYTCYMTYADQATGLGPDEMIMDAWPEGNQAARWVNHIETWNAAGRPGGTPPGVGEVLPEGPGRRDYRPRKTGYLLRPETIESIYVLWKTTGDPRWRERGWSIFQAIEKYTRTASGYASLSSVDVSSPPMLDEMPSYFLAETLKYLYLLFCEGDLIPFDEWVFNTEAHPFPVYTWSAWEKKQYHIH